ncbi:MAG: hypothetical protein JO284_12380 [Planctomycetaceae bacterium]|nr:hypothetical protein [Planctomycetaceae bacterium]
MNILIVSEGAAGIQLLRALSRTDYRVVAVMASPPAPGGRDATVWGVAEQLGYPTWPAAWVKDPRSADRIRSHDIDILINIYSIFLFHREILGATRLGCFNVHPGPLPRYAGLNSMCWAIYRGETTHGVTIHEMQPTIDTGPIVSQSLFPIEDGDTGLRLASRCIKVGVALALQLLETAARVPGSIPRVAQDLSRREYFGRGVPQGGRLDWQRPARDVVNFVRACDFAPYPSPWGCPRATLEDRQIGIAKASRTGLSAELPPGTVEHAAGSEVEVACADEWITIHRLLIDGRSVAPDAVLKTGDRLVAGR